MWAGSALLSVLPSVRQPVQRTFFVHSIQVLTILLDILIGEKYVYINLGLELNSILYINANKQVLIYTDFSRNRTTVYTKVRSYFVLFRVLSRMFIILENLVTYKNAAYGYFKY